MDLFEFSEWKARVHDPSTSQQAAVEVQNRLSGLRAQFVQGIRMLGGKATANEAASVVEPTNHQLAESIRKRAKECVERGAVRVVGERDCRVSGNRCQVYEVNG